MVKENLIMSKVVTKASFENAIKVNKWTHFAVTVTSNKVKIYLDGSLHSIHKLPEKSFKLSDEMKISLPEKKNEIEKFNGVENKD